jgi:hypothetical protein
MRLSGWAKALRKRVERPAAELDAAALALVADAQAAARLRAYQNDPNVAALTIERTRDRLDRWGWLFLFAGLAYTTVNVQAFVAGGALVWTLRWLTAWLVEPMVMGLMLVLLRGEQIANRHGEQSGRWVLVTRWASLLITYVMNTGTYWNEGNWGEAFVHSVPVVLVFLAAEALVQQRLTLTSVVEKLGRPRPEPQRPAAGVTGVSTQSVVVMAELAQDGPERPEPAQSVPDQSGPLQDELSGSRSLKEQAYAAFAELAVERDGDIAGIGPAEVDRRAGIRVGTSKVPGRMEQFRTRYLREREEVNSDGDEDSESPTAEVSTE